MTSGHRQRDVADRHPRQRVDQTEAFEDRHERDQDRDPRQHVREHHRGVCRAPPREAEAGDRVGAEQPEEGRYDRGGRRHQKAVPQAGFEIRDTHQLVEGDGGRRRRNDVRAGQQIHPPLQRPENDNHAERDDDQQHDAECEQRRNDSCPEFLTDLVQAAPEQGEAKERRRHPGPEREAERPGDLDEFENGGYEDEHCPRDTHGSAEARLARHERNPLARPLVRSRASTTTNAVTM